MTPAPKQKTIAESQHQHMDMPACQRGNVTPRAFQEVFTFPLCTCFSGTASAMSANDRIYTRKYYYVVHAVRPLLVHHVLYNTAAVHAYSS